MRRTALVVAAVVWLGVLSAPPAGAATCADVFPSAFVAQLRDAHPSQRFTAAVYDARTGCWYHLNRGLRLTTASVVKAAVLGAVLLRDQDAGRGLSDWERARIRPMIQLSHNNPYTSDLYGSVGGVAGMDRFDRRMGATATTNSSSYGATWTTAEDRTRIVLRLLHGGGPLRAAGRTEAWRYMSTVHPTQRWGASAGVPRGWAVALKNGFYPMRGYGWRVGTTAFVRHVDTRNGYAISVLTDGSSSQLAGMSLVEKISRRVASTLAGAPAAPRSVDRARCTVTTAGEPWGAVARRVGLSADAAASVRAVSGGNASPLSGQRACSPYLSP